NHFLFTSIFLLLRQLLERFERFELFEPILFKSFQSFKSFKPSKSMSNAAFKSVANLYPVTEGIIAINRVTTLFVPGNFRWVRTPVVFSSVEPFKDRRGQFLRRPAHDSAPPPRPAPPLS